MVNSSFLMRNLALWLLLTALAPASASEPAFRTLAAFDVGSGSTRMLVADVALCTGDILAIHDARKANVAYSGDLLSSHDQRFSDEIQQQANRTMAEFSELATELGAEQMIGVATQAFRQAANGQRLLDDWQRELGLHIHIISQTEEARMAYRLVAARLQRPAANLLVWDIGAGSQQMVWRDREDGSWHHHNSDVASVSFRNRALRQLQRPASHQSPNPIDAEEAERLSAELTAWLAEEESEQAFARVADYLAAGAQVVGIGGVHGASLANQLGLKAGDEITREAIRSALSRQMGRSDQDIGGDYADTEVSNLILVGTLMDRYGIDRYQVMAMNLTEAVLLEMVDDCTPGRH